MGIQQHKEPEIRVFTSDSKGVVKEVTKENNEAVLKRLAELNTSDLRPEQTKIQEGALTAGQRESQGAGGAGPRGPTFNPLVTGFYNYVEENEEVFREPAEDIANFVAHPVETIIKGGEYIVDELTKTAGKGVNNLVTPTLTDNPLIFVAGGAILIFLLKK